MKQVEVFDGVVVALGSGDCEGWYDADANDYITVTTATIEFTQRSDGSKWISEWEASLWKDHPKGVPDRGDVLVVTTTSHNGITSHETVWTPRERKPWSPELLARISSEMKEDT